MGGWEAPTLVGVEPTLGYHPWCSGVLTVDRYPAIGKCQVGSLTGAVASKVGRPDGNIRGKPGYMLESPSLNSAVLRSG